MPSGPTLNGAIASRISESSSAAYPSRRVTNASSCGLSAFTDWMRDSVQPRRGKPQLAIVGPDGHARAVRLKEQLLRCHISTASSLPSGFTSVTASHFIGKSPLSLSVTASVTVIATAVFVSVTGSVTLVRAFPVTLVVTLVNRHFPSYVTLGHL